jgi:arginyl-tRNA synthetase
MRKLTVDEYNELPIRGKGRSTDAFNSIINLQVGEALLIENKDWKRKAGPSTLVRYIEKKYNRNYTCSAVSSAGGWVVKRIEKTAAAITDNNIHHNDKNQSERLRLKSALVIFYIGRMAFYKIDRIEDSLKACINHFKDVDALLVEELFHEVIKALEEQGHIVKENGKTYIPLKRF